MIYPDYCNQVMLLNKIAARRRLKPYSIGKSVCGRDIRAVDIGSSCRRALIVGGVHGTEYLTILAALKLLAGELKRSGYKPQLCRRVERGKAP